MEGFRSIEVQPLPGDRFGVRSLIPQRRLTGQVSGHFFRNEKWVGAQVVIWE